jgi:Fe-S-cluster formation regulator IscX/YfhJ
MSMEIFTSDFSLLLISGLFLQLVLITLFFRNFRLIQTQFNEQKMEIDKHSIFLQNVQAKLHDQKTEIDKHSIFLQNVQAKLHDQKTEIDKHPVLFNQLRNEYVNLNKMNETILETVEKIAALSRYEAQYHKDVRKSLDEIKGEVTEQSLSKIKMDQGLRKLLSE